jgi:hypothetical protein
MTSITFLLMKILKYAHWYKRHVHKIPQQDVTYIIHNISEYNENIATDIQIMLNIILQQNYFQSANQYYTQKTGLWMEAPTSAITAEKYLQSIEHNQI